jgi:hypothetical protein
VDGAGEPAGDQQADRGGGEQGGGGADADRDAGRCRERVLQVPGQRGRDGAESLVDVGAEQRRPGREHEPAAAAQAQSPSRRGRLRAGGGAVAMGSLLTSGSVLAAFFAGGVALFAPCCIVFLAPGYLALAATNNRWRLLPLPVCSPPGWCWCRSRSASA